MGGGKTGPIKGHGVPCYESSDQREIPPRKPPKRRPLTQNQDSHYRFKRMDQTERRYTTPMESSWLPVEPRERPKQTGKTLIVLDIDKRYDTYGYEISSEGNKVIFRADPSYLFRQVKKGNDIAWTPKDDGQYPYKVVYKHINGEDDIKIFFPRPEDFDSNENIGVMTAERPVYDMSKDPNYMYTQNTHEKSVPIPQQHTQPGVNTHQAEYTHIPMGSEPIHPQMQTPYNQFQMPAQYTHLPMAPEQTHAKVPGVTRSFDTTEAHGSYTHGTDPRFSGSVSSRPGQNFDNQMTPEFTRIPMTSDHTASRMEPEITQLHMTPEQTHAKVPGVTRSFDTTEAHGSYTHGTDPRFSGSVSSRPGQNFDNQMTPEFTRIPMTSDHTASRMEPEITQLHMTPEQTHAKVPGVTRSFDTTEAHGSYTHGTDPRFSGSVSSRPGQNFDNQMTPEFTRIPMTSDHTASRMEPEITQLHMTPEQTHAKVPGVTRSFDTTEAHGSYTHGTDPRFSGSVSSRPGQNFDNQMTPEFTRIPMTSDHTASRMEPEITQLHMTPEQTHAKVPGVTRSFDTTEAHGSYTHGTDPRFSGSVSSRPGQNFDNQMTPEFTRIPMTSDHTASRMEPEITQLHMTPEQTHAKVPGVTRSFDTTEAHGSYTHGTDPRFSGSVSSRPGQNFDNQMTPEFTRIPMTSDHTASRMEPEITQLHMTPEQTHAKVPGVTRSFDTTEAHGSYTHGTDPRFSGSVSSRPGQNFDNQMTPEFTRIPMTSDHTASRMEPEITQLHMTPEQTHAKVPGVTRSFDTTEAHGSYTHGTDPRFSGSVSSRPGQNFDNQMTPEFTRIPMTSDHTASRMEPEITQLHMTPEQTHAKVPGVTRSFDTTEAHGSYTHGTDPRFSGSVSSRPGQNFDNQMTPEFTRIPMTSDHTASRMEPEITQLHMTPEQTHAKVPGVTRSFDTTEAHGSYTHGTDPRFSGSVSSRPGQNFDNQMTPEFTRIPMTSDHTASRMEPEITQLHMTPEQTHAKVPGVTRSFDTTEAHGSYTHGTDPRFSGSVSSRPGQNFDNQMTPEFTRIPMTSDHTASRMEPEITQLHMTPEQTHAKVPGVTRSFDTTEAHGSYTHGTDPRFSRRVSSITDLHYGQEVQSRITDPIRRLRQRQRQIEETERHKDHTERDLRQPDSTELPGRPYPESSKPQTMPMTQPSSSPMSTVLHPTPASLSPNYPVHEPAQVPTATPTSTATPTAKQVATSHEPTFTPEQEPEPTTSEQMTKIVKTSLRESEGIQYMTLHVPAHPGDKPSETSPIQPESRPKEAEKQIPDEVVEDRSCSQAERDTSQGGSYHPQSKVMVDASTSTINYTDASTQFPERSVPVRRVETSEKTTCTDDIGTVERPAKVTVARMPKSRDSAQREEVLIEPTPSEEPITEAPAPEPPKRHEPIRRESPRDDVITDDEIIVEERPEGSTRAFPARQEPVRQTTVGEGTVRESAERGPIPGESTPMYGASRGPRPTESRTRDDANVNQPGSAGASGPIPSTSGEGIRRTTTATGDRINITQSQNEIRINTTDPENGNYSIDIDPKKHEKVVLTFATNSTVFVLDGASHTLGLNQGVEPGNVITDRLTMQRSQTETGGLIGGPSPVGRDTTSRTRTASADQRDPEGRPTDRRPEKFTIPQEELEQPAPPPYTTSGYSSPPFIPPPHTIPNDRSLERMLQLLEINTMSNLAQLSRPVPYTPRTRVNVTHNPHDPPAGTNRSEDSDSEEMAARSQEASRPTVVDPFGPAPREDEPNSEERGEPNSEGQGEPTSEAQRESNSEEQGEAISIDQADSISDDQGESISEDQGESISVGEDGTSGEPPAQPKPRSRGDGNGNGSPITIPLEEDESESGTEFSLNMDATDIDPNMCETKQDATTNEFTYTFKSTTRCTEVRIDNVTIWKKGQQNVNVPRNVKHNKAKNEIIITNGTKGLVYKLVSGTWKYHSTETYTEGGTNQSKSGTPDKKKPANKKPVELNIKKKDSTDEFKYVKKDKIGTYMANEGYGFNRVVSSGRFNCCRSGKDIWDANVKNEYGNKVVVNGLGDKKKTLTIHFDETEKVTFKKDENDWIQQKGAKQVHGWSWNCFGGNCCSGSSAGSSDKSEKTAEVDINKRSGDGYIGDENGSKFTFKPQSGYSINAVKLDSTVIWKTEKSDEYSNKVTVEYVDGILTIYIGSNESSKKVFKRGAENKWEEDTNASTHKSGTTGSGGGTTPSSQPTGGGTGTGGTTGTAGANQSDGNSTTKSGSGTDTSGGSTQQATPD
ncbi:hypothetical protein MACJ_002511 [Theileria orientalis]|uniref:Uncharacterized protein n=1 Tax=Theileria orientalis TaxID=68886 RepID=A0A976QRF2_THEOR|nr:hypothetical protein MACJ_002511 [Theileria orientalis]